MVWAYLCLASAWILFCLFHSLLSAVRVELALRRGMGGLAPWYRLAYNIFALITILPPLYMEKAWANGLLLDFGSWDILRQVIFYGALAIFLWVLAFYNGTNISGLSPTPGPEALSPAGDFKTGGPLRYVRHPLYSLAVVLLYTRPMTDTALVTSTVLCIYIFIGAWLEEKKLIIRFGEAYLKYKQEVPAFIPFRIFW